MRVNPIRLKQAMDHAGINQTMLADIMGVRMETISRYMNGHNEPQVTGAVEPANERM